MTDATRTFLVTGAYGAIGNAIARQLAADPSHAVVLAGRNATRGAAAVTRIQHHTGNSNVRFVPVDVSRASSVQALADRWDGPLHVLINNAAICPRRRTETPDGLEVQFATNIMGYVWMTQAFAPILAANAPARIINVASGYAGNLDITDLQFEKRRYENNAAYRQSKQANRMLTVAYANRLQPRGIIVHACHPGVVTSTLCSDLGFSGYDSPDEAAQTPVWLATSPAVAGKTGLYASERRFTPCQFARDTQAIEALYNACMAFVPERLKAG